MGIVGSTEQSGYSVSCGLRGLILANAVGNCEEIRQWYCKMSLRFLKVNVKK